eukprot:m.53107 g.53107  ORF g.53107 m.53107 type:complete len:109 (-) comp10841_c0_seq2:512-838(-)
MVLTDTLKKSKKQKQVLTTEHQQQTTIQICNRCLATGCFRAKHRVFCEYHHLSTLSVKFSEVQDVAWMLLACYLRHILEAIQNAFQHLALLGQRERFQTTLKGLEIVG